LHVQIAPEVVGHPHFIDGFGQRFDMTVDALAQFFGRIRPARFGCCTRGCR